MKASKEEKSYFYISCSLRENEGGAKRPQYDTTIKSPSTNIGLKTMNFILNGNDKHSLLLDFGFIHSYYMIPCMIPLH